MAGRSSKSNAPQARKRVEAETPSTAAAATLKRGRDGSAFARCDECNSSVPVALIDMHSCSLEAKIKMNLEAQVIEKPAEVKKKSEVKKKPAERKRSSVESESKPKKKLKKSGDASKPKRPQTAFFLFMADFRKTFKEENKDNNKVTECAKMGGEKWKSLSDEEKKPYMDKAAELKAEFKAMESNTTENANDDETLQPEELCDADDETHQPEELCDADADELHQPEELCDDDA